VTGRVCEKIAQNVAQPIFYKINSKHFTTEKVAQKFGLLLQLQKIAQSKQTVQMFTKICPIRSPCLTSRRDNRQRAWKNIGLGND
jgi:hypothetical protein